jgi:25S rRNA (uracil2634-N3)-methyltransferase
VAFFKNALTSLAPGGSIIVTLFEGVPYTLWNIRDLARHSGLQVERSFKFQAKAYPGYKHARTLGVVKRKDGKEGGGWRGEERESRSYIFMRKGDVAEVNGGDKRKRGDSSSESEDESSVEDENPSTDWDEDEQEEEEEAEEVDEDDVDGLHENEENEQDEGRDGHD